jgi:hypothetical protein
MGFRNALGLEGNDDFPRRRAVSEPREGNLANAHVAERHTFACLLA